MFLTYGGHQLRTTTGGKGKLNINVSTSSAVDQYSRSVQ
jgi:hypothetical protein